MRVAVLGAGNGGHAMAAELALNGHEVTLHSGDPQKLRDLQANRGGVSIVGVLGERHVPLAKVTGDVAEAVAGADLVALPVPGMVQEAYLRRALPHVAAGQAVCLSPGTGGSLVAERILRELGRSGVLLIETLTLPYAARMNGPASVGISSRIGARCAAFPAKRTPEALALLRQCYRDATAGTNVLETTLQNVNCIIHPLPSLMNWGWIEARERMFSLYGEGMTPGVLKCLYASDRERVEVCEAARVSTIPIDDIYTLLGIRALYRESMGLGKAEHYEDRFVTEDVPIGLVTIASIGAQIGVRTPFIAAIIALSNALYDADFWATGRTAEKMGLAGLDVPQIAEYLHEGIRGA